MAREVRPPLLFKSSAACYNAAIRSREDKDMELLHGRPADCTGRLEREVRTYDFLDALGIEYWRTDHADMPAMTMED